MKWSENVTSFGIKRDCNWLDLDKVSLILTNFKERGALQIKTPF